MKTRIKESLFALIVLMGMTLALPQWANAQQQDKNSEEVEEIIEKHGKEIEEKIKEFANDVELDAENWQKELEKVNIQKDGTITFKDKSVNVLESIEDLLLELEQDVDNINLNIEGCEHDDDIECLREALKDVPEKMEEALEWLKQQDVNISTNKGVGTKKSSDDNNDN